MRSGTRLASRLALAAAVLAAAAALGARLYLIREIERRLEAALGGEAAVSGLDLDVFARRGAVDVAWRGRGERVAAQGLSVSFDEEWDPAVVRVRRALWRGVELNGSAALTQDGAAWTAQGALKARLPLAVVPSTAVHLASGTVRGDAAFSAAWSTRSWIVAADGRLAWTGVVVATHAWSARSSGSADFTGLEVSSAGIRLAEIASATSTRIVLYDDVFPEPALELEAVEMRVDAWGTPRARASLGARTLRNAEVRVSYVPEPGRAKLDVTGLQLPPLSRYAERVWGRRVETGTLSVRAEAAFGERVRGEAKVHLRGFKLDGSATSNLQLNTTLALLRDGKGDIELTLPIEGAWNDLRLNWTEALGKVVYKGLKAASFGAASALFPPLRAAKLALEGAGFIFKWRFAPLPFDLDSPILRADAVETLKDWGPGLKAKRDLRLRVCGRAAEGEDPTLADARARAVQTHLVEVHGVPAERLLLCVEKEPGEPAVELALY